MSSSKTYRSFKDIVNNNNHSGQLKHSTGNFYRSLINMKQNNGAMQKIIWKVISAL